MHRFTIHSLFNCLAKQVGVMPSYWSTIETSNDRTPGVSGSREMIV
jgi:hypothetical protein